MHWQNGGDDDVPRLRPRVLADDQKLTTGKNYAGAQTEVFLRGNYKFRNEEMIPEAATNMAARTASGETCQ
jgi:hypothetical protein